MTKPPLALAQALQVQSQTGQSLLSLSESKPTLTFLLRHFGCPFCRDLLSILAARRAGIEATGVQLAVVHMGTEAEAGPFFASFGLETLPRFSDPKRLVYQSLGIPRGSLWELFGPAVLRRAKTIVQRGVGIPVGDVFQLAGAVVLFRGEVIQRFTTKSSAELLAPLQTQDPRAV